VQFSAFSPPEKILTYNTSFKKQQCFFSGNHGDKRREGMNSILAIKRESGFFRAVSCIQLYCAEAVSSTQRPCTCGGAVDRKIGQTHKKPSIGCMKRPISQMATLLEKKRSTKKNNNWPKNTNPALHIFTKYWNRVLLLPKRKQELQWTCAPSETHEAHYYNTLLLQRVYPLPPYVWHRI